MAQLREQSRFQATVVQLLLSNRGRQLDRRVVALLLTHDPEDFGLDDQCGADMVGGMVDEITQIRARVDARRSES